MSKPLAVIALIALTLSVIVTFVALLTPAVEFADALSLTAELLSWEVIAGGLAIGATNTFGSEIREMIARLGTSAPEVG